MAIEDILQALQDQAQSDCDECLQEANAHAKHILDEAEREAAAIHEQHVAQVERAARNAASQLVNAARLESKMKVSSVKGDGLESVFSTAREQLFSIRDRADYGQAFDAMLAEALQGVEGEVVVKVNPADVGAAQAKLASSGVSGQAVGDDSIIGGALVEVDGGSILRRNTLEDRLDRARDFVQNDVAKVLLA